MGGIGKTQLALQYSISHEMNYDAIFWLRSQTELEMSSSYSEIAVNLRSRHKLPGGSASDNMNIEEARDWLETTDDRWLIVFDNVDGLGIIDKFVPQTSTGRGAIIITTQLPNFPVVVRDSQKLALQSLSISDCTTLLFKFLGREPRDLEESSQACEVASIVGCLPLAIATIGGAISHSNSTINEFLQHLKRSDKIWETTEAQRVQGYDRTLGTVFEVGLGKLPGPARKLLNILAYLNPDSIPVEMLRGEHEDSELQFLSNLDELVAAVGALNLRQLARREPTGNNGPFLAIHRTLQLSILHSLSSDPALRLRIFNQVFSIVRRQLPPPSEHQGWRHGLFEKYKIYVPQLVSLHYHGIWPEPRVQLTLEFAKTMIDIGTYMWRTGQYRACKEGLEEAEKILEAEGLDTETHILYSAIDDILGVICDRSGALFREDGLRRRKRAVNIREEVWKKNFAAIPPENVNLIENIRRFNPHANFACTYIQSENFEAAEAEMELCFENYKSWGTESDEANWGLEQKLELWGQHSKYYHHTSFGLMAQGKVDEALYRVKKSCELQVKHAGEQNLMYIAYKSRYGLLLYHAGNIGEALTVLEEVRDAYKNMCGDANALTLDVTCFLAGIMLEDGQSQDVDKAKAYLDHCLRPAHRADWSEVCIALSEYRLAKALTLQSNTNEATEHAAHAKACRERHLRERPQYFKGIEHDDQAVHDQMASFWHYRMTGRLKQRLP